METDNSGEQPITGSLTLNGLQLGTFTATGTSATDPMPPVVQHLAGETPPSLPALALAGRALALRAEAVEVIVAAMRGASVAFMDDEFDEPAEAAEEVGDVAVIPLKGVITPDGGGGLFSFLFGGGGGLKTFRERVAKAADDSSISNIVLDVDSPGGIVDMVPETAAFLREVAKSKPVTAVANTMVASAAYWLASQANELVITPSGEVGSIGVYVAHTDVSKAMDRFGESVTLISAGKYKTEGNPYEPLDEEAAKALQENVDLVYGMFVGDVAAGRKTSDVAVRNGYGQGRTLRPPAAVSSGLADRVATLDEVVASLTGEPEEAPDAAAVSEATAQQHADQAEMDALIELGRV